MLYIFYSYDSANARHLANMIAFFKRIKYFFVSNSFIAIIKLSIIYKQEVSNHEN